MHASLLCFAKFNKLKKSHFPSACVLECIPENSCTIFSVPQLSAENMTKVCIFLSVSRQTCVNLLSAVCHLTCCSDQ